MKQIKESLDEINSSNTMIAVIGIVIAITAIIATIYNSKKLNQQLHSNEREIRHRMRPIIVRGKYDDGNTYQIKHEYGLPNYQ